MSGYTQEADAAHSPLPDDVVDSFFSDPPYYDSIPYSHLSEFFSLWLGLMGLVSLEPANTVARRQRECIVDEGLGKGRGSYEEKITASMLEARRVTKPAGLGVVVFAHKSTSEWESQLKAMIDAGWVITGSWPIDTERSGRLRAYESVALASSVHLVCRPRENPDGSVHMDDIGDWRDVLAELPRRIHEWMPRLADEGGRMKDGDGEVEVDDEGVEFFIRHPSSFILEYDATRKIAQGLGVHIEQIESVVEVKGDKARLCSVAERTRHLFGKDEAAPGAKARRKKKLAQKTLFEELDETESVEGGWSEMKKPALGETVLDRVHQAMILFAAGRSKAVKRFLIEDGAGTDARFWKLAQSLSAL
jgi:hypothetical protein